MVKAQVNNKIGRALLKEPRERKIIPDKKMVRPIRYTMYFEKNRKNEDRALNLTTRGGYPAKLIIINQ
jgi:hypothetical protein